MLYIIVADHARLGVANSVEIAEPSLENPSQTYQLIYPNVLKFFFHQRANKMASLVLAALTVLAALNIADSKQYVVYPEDRTDLGACSTINTNLIHYLTSDDVTSYTSLRRSVTEFWLINATESQQDTIKQMIGVSYSVTRIRL